MGASGRPFLLLGGVDRKDRAPCTILFSRRPHISVHYPSGKATKKWSRSPQPKIIGAVRSLSCIAPWTAVLTGLDCATALEHLQTYGRNSLKPERQRNKILLLFLERFRSPLVLILIFAAFVSAVVRDWLDTLIILAIVLISAVLSFIQEYRATSAVAKLRQRVSVKSTLLRDGQELTLPSDAVVPGDIVRLTAGSLIPADGVLLDAKDFHVTQALLTGETFPVEKQPGVVSADASLTERSNCVFMGTSVRSGTATVLVVHTGQRTHYGRIADALSLRPPETEFERGLRQFGILLFRIMVLIVLACWPSTSSCNTPPWKWSCSRWRSRSGCRPNCCPRSSASHWRAAPSTWPVTASSCAGSTPSRTSAA